MIDDIIFQNEAKELYKKLMFNNGTVLDIYYTLRNFYFRGVIKGGEIASEEEWAEIEEEKNGGAK